MAKGRKTGGRVAGTPNNRTRLARAAAPAVTCGASATPLDFLMAVIQSPDVPLEQRIRAATVAIPYTHARPAAETRIVEVTRTVVEEPGRDRALTLTFAGGLTDDEADDLAALNAQVIAPIVGPPQ
jgi:hypothetical protein